MYGVGAAAVVCRARLAVGEAAQSLHQRGVGTICLCHQYDPFGPRGGPGRAGEGGGYGEASGAAHILH
jgi:hypothetical protein